ncbi:hypothetical protein VTO42DRAFT_6291 [Malbranchea cinnamomea]
MASDSVDEVNVCVSTADTSRLMKKEATLREWVVNNQIGIPVTILAMIFALHSLYPSLRPYTTPFLQLPHFQPERGAYVQGWDDIYFIISSILGFTAVRAFAIDWVFQPIARSRGLKRKNAIRFAEQAWLLVYDSTFWTYGMYLWYNSNYWLDFRAIWQDWPSRDISGPFKCYCLLQLSFWFQQIFVINIEARRKDHYQMLTHHIITSTLLGSAYIYGFYNVANVVLCLMDIVDFLLPGAKMLKYMGYEFASTVAFGVFLAVWFVARHVLYMSLWWSIYKNVPDVMPFGCYSGITGEMITTDGAPDNWSHLLYPFWDINGPICMSPRIKWTFLSFLLMIQTLSLIWFGMILRIAVNVLRSGVAEDTRSDDEDERVPENGTKVQNGDGFANGVTESSEAEHGWQRMVVSTGTDLNHPPVRIRTPRGRVTLSDQNERKALLGRIGCDKPASA